MIIRNSRKYNKKVYRSIKYTIEFAYTKVGNVTLFCRCRNNSYRQQKTLQIDYK
jgi:hypothetical protein